MNYIVALKVFVSIRESDQSIPTIRVNEGVFVVIGASESGIFGNSDINMRTSTQIRFGRHPALTDWLSATQKPFYPFASSPSP